MILHICNILPCIVKNHMTLWPYDLSYMTYIS